jgi:hypothetical protein
VTAYALHGANGPSAVWDTLVKPAAPGRWLALAGAAGAFDKPRWRNPKKAYELTL